MDFDDDPIRFTINGKDHIVPNITVDFDDTIQYETLGDNTVFGFGDRLNEIWLQITSLPNEVDVSKINVRHMAAQSILQRCVSYEKISDGVLGSGWTHPE